MASAKNFAISPAAMDLGLSGGDTLKSQLESEEEERRKKLMQQASQMSPAGQSLFGPHI